MIATLLTVRVCGPSQQQGKHGRNLVGMRRASPSQNNTRSTSTAIGQQPQADPCEAGPAKPRRGRKVSQAPSLCVVGGVPGAALASAAQCPSRIKNVLNASQCRSSFSTPKAGGAAHARPDAAYHGHQIQTRATTGVMGKARLRTKVRTPSFLTQYFDHHARRVHTRPVRHGTARVILWRIARASVH